MTFARILCLTAGAALLALSSPALADVKAGVDAWTAGDFGAAVREWRDPAAKGDPDAQFNMAQAYRLGRGVEANPKQAEVLYAKAAAQGHIKAADNYGLLLFQDGRREEAMPYLTAAAGRGDPRAQYLIGLAHFNGDLLPKDWVRAYALLTLSNSAGLPQAAPALQQMDSFIPREQREQAQSVAQTIKRETDASRAAQLAAVDLAVDGEMGGPAVAAAARPAILPERSAAIPAPIPSASVPPSVAAARAAIEEASRVTGTESPASAGADYVPSTQAGTRVAQAARVAPPPVRPSTPVEKQITPVTAPTKTPPAVQSVKPMTGPWKVQLGAFSVAGNADRLWRQLSARSELAGATKMTVPTGGLTKLLAGGFPTRAAAEAACAGLKRSGQACLVTR